MLQSYGFGIFLAGAAIVVAVFAWVAASTRRPAQVDVKSAYRIRRRFFAVLGAILVAFLLVTLPRAPYAKESDIPQQTVFVVGKQFSFGISAKPITNDQEWEAATTAEPVSVAAGQLVEFRVTSFDVNHGFAIFSPEGTLIGQAQAMPRYVNRLHMRFDRPGRYTAMCLELCGMSHPRMRGVFDVK
jgi:cytochrome c oxidase subunit 2